MTLTKCTYCGFAINPFHVCQPVAGATGYEIKWGPNDQYFEIKQRLFSVGFNQAQIDALIASFNIKELVEPHANNH